MKEIIYDYARKQCNTDKYVLSLLEQQISYVANEECRETNNTTYLLIGG